MNTGIVPPWLRGPGNLIPLPGPITEKANRIDYHVVRSGPYWALRAEGQIYPNQYHMTKAEAVGAGIMQARTDGVSLIVHGKDGKIQTVYSYDNARWPD